jgi:serine/threonine protein kinase
VANPAVKSARFLAPGDKLGKHDLIRQIAVGGMAELYLARTVGLEGFEKLVVLKRILPQFVGNANFVNMFLNEARLAATLHHPNIAQVFDIDQDGADYFFAMEYIHGEDLGHLAASANESGVPLSLDASLTLVAGLCAGLHYAHEKVGPDGKPLNVVHRDVSPSNVLVSYDGAVKLVDFGIARAGSNPSTTRGGLKGKIAYMSPEQCRGKVALDRRSDVFSIGTILYELTTGRLPFTDETEYGILNQIVNRDAEPPSQFVPGFSPALEAIVMRALARDLEQRYPTALEMQKDIEDFAHENRLRISPLVLARLMGSLYPTRLEEWDHARAQGAFFVEQHVLRTLIENRRGDDAPPDPDEDVTGQTVPDDTTVGPPPVDESTKVQARAHGRAPGPLPGMPPRHVAAVPSPAPRPSSPALGAAQPAPRQSEPTLRVPTSTSPPPAPPQGFPVVAPVPIALVQEQPPPPSRMVTPLPGRLPSPPLGRLSAPTPVPGQPGAVPIVTPYAAPAVPPVVVPGGGTLVTNHATGSIPPLTYPLVNQLDVTERVRARAPAAPGETALVKIGRSRTPVIVIAATGVLAAVVAGIIVFSGGKKEADASRPAAVEPAPESSPPETAEADPSAVKSANPATAKAGAPTTSKPDDPATADDPVPARAGDPERQDPKLTKKTSRSIRQTSRGKQTRGSTRSEKESKWVPDSPFMPVRTDKK